MLRFSRVLALSALVGVLLALFCFGYDVQASPILQDADPTPGPSDDSGPDEWVTGHYWAIKVVEAYTADELDGTRPEEGQFVVVEVDWKTATDLEVKHQITAVDFALVASNGTPYRISGTIYCSEDYSTEGPDQEYHDGKWVTTTVAGNGNGTFKLVFDVPVDLDDAKLWFRNFPKIQIDPLLEDETAVEEVALQTGTIRLEIVDPEGNAVDVEPNLFLIFPEDMTDEEQDELEESFHANPFEVTRIGPGEYRLTGVIPGQYAVLAGDSILGSVFTVEPNEMVDLGELILESD